LLRPREVNIIMAHVAEGNFHHAKKEGHRHLDSLVHRFKKRSNITTNLGSTKS